MKSGARLTSPYDKLFVGYDCINCSFLMKGAAQNNILLRNDFFVHSSWITTNLASFENVKWKIWIYYMPIRTYLLDRRYSPARFVTVVSNWWGAAPPTPITNPYPVVVQELHCATWFPIYITIRSIVRRLVILTTGEKKFIFVIYTYIIF